MESRQRLATQDVSTDKNGTHHSQADENDAKPQLLQRRDGGPSVTSSEISKQIHKTEGVRYRKTVSQLPQRERRGTYNHSYQQS